MNTIICLIISFIMSFLPFLNSFIPEKSFMEKISTITEKVQGTNVIAVDENGMEIDENLFAPENADKINAVLPLKYDARNEGIITPSKSQGNTGCCWAFAAVSAAETSMIKNNYVGKDVDLSEAHLVWFGLRTVVKTKRDSANGDGVFSSSPFSDGGSWNRSVFALARWSGTAYEKDFPFEGLLYPEGNYPEKDRYNSVGHLQNSRYISPDDSEGIKQAILDCGSITVSYYHTNTFLNLTDENGPNYFQQSVTNTNHTVTIIGWDDNYSKNNFKITPEKDGAWLVKNSWGKSWGDNGCFWISYCDTSLSHFVTFEMEDSQNYENINQYDGFGYKGWGYVKGYNQMSMANIFKTKNSETIRAVSFYTVQPGVNYTVEIYKNIPENGKPTDGEFVTSESGYMKDRGYKTVRLTNPVNLPEKTGYSAVVTVTVSDETDACIPFEHPEGFDGASNRVYHSEKGQSFLTINREFDQWEDTSEKGYNNVCIKTFSDNNSLRLSDISDYRISAGALGYVEMKTPTEEILNQFRNRNVYIENGYVLLKNNSGEIIDKVQIAYTGDVDNDGDLDYDDLVLLGSIAFYGAEPDKREWYSSDIDKSRKVNADDWVLLRDYLYDGGII